jgi:arylformamidase
MPTNEWIDVTWPVFQGMVHWPGDPVFEASREKSIPAGDVCNLTRMSLSAHTGTHMDAPLHFIDGGEPMEAMPIDAVAGRARVIEIDDPLAIGPDELAKHELKRGEIVLFKTRNSHEYIQSPTFVEDFVHISAAGAKHLVERGVKTVGVDYLSIGGFKTDGVECHRIILGAGIWVIEGLDLRKIEPGDYELVCLPLKLVGADGAPARAIMRRV